LSAKVRTSFIDSDRTYGARRIWKDVLADGVSCGLHRIERLMRQQALRARPRRRRLPPDSGERQTGAVAPNVLERSFNAPAPNRRWICRLHLHLDGGRLALCCRRDRSVLAPGRRLADERDDDGRAGHRCAGDGDLATRQIGCAHPSLRSRQPIHQRSVPAADGPITASPA
jgi:transposase InsO family protein